MVSIATPVKRNAEIKAGRSPKFSIPMARAPKTTVKLSHDKKVRSLAKKTLGSTRVGRAMRLPYGREVIVVSWVWPDSGRVVYHGICYLPGAV